MTVGIFFSKCGGALSRTLDLEDLAREFRKEAHVRIFEDFYGEPDFDEVLSEVKDNGIDALVLAGDPPTAYQRVRNSDYLLNCLAERGVNGNRVEAVNLNNFLARAHKASRSGLMEKARLLVRVGLEKVRRTGPVDRVEVAPRKAVAVVGANASSLAASQLLLDAGIKVFLVHEGERIEVPPEHAEFCRPTLTYVTRHPRFVDCPRSAPSDLSGYAGDYELTIRTDGREERLPIGAVILSLIDDRRSVKAAQSTFRIDIGEDGRLASLDENSARSQTHERGIFLVNPPPGTNGDYSVRILAADAAAAQALNLLSAVELYHRVAVSKVDENVCGGCGACVKTCMFHAVTLAGDPPASHIDIRRCRGCGNCVTACPAGARDLLTCPSEYLFTAIDTLAQFRPEDGQPRVLLFACQGCGYTCLDQAARGGSTWPIGVMPLSVVCGGQLDMQMILHAFVQGFDGIALLICGEGCCHHVIGNVDLERRVNLFRGILESRGLDDHRMKVISTCSREGKACVEALNDFCEQLAEEVHSWR